MNNHVMKEKYWFVFDNLLFTNSGRKKNQKCTVRKNLLLYSEKKQVCLYFRFLDGYSNKN